MNKIKCFLLFILIATFYTNCHKKTIPCFDYEQTDSLIVNFDASCSQNAYKYNWSFDNETVVTTSPKVSYKFNTSGEHKVMLDVLNKRNKHKNGFTMEVVTERKTITIY